MSERVAVRRSHWQSLTVYHDLDADGNIDCRTGNRDIAVRIVEKRELPDHVERCANCAEEYDEPTHSGPSWAQKLRAADDPEEVLQS